jgi:Tfp pilus assembly protein PilP
MNILIATLSMLAVLLLAVPQMVASNDAANNSNNTVQTTQVMLPVNSMPVSELQHDWQEKFNLLEQKKQEANKPKVVESRNQRALTIGNQVFTLMGIFSQNGSTFVLIKDEQQALSKVTQGDTIGNSVKLINITTSSITLATPEQTKTFKLFQWRSNDKTS